MLFHYYATNGMSINLGEYHQTANKRPSFLQVAKTLDNVGLQWSEQKI